MKCIECGFRNPHNAKYCIECGYPIVSEKTDDILCEKCGHRNLKSNNFCTECGNRFHIAPKNKEKGTKQQNKAKFRIKKKINTSFESSKKKPFSFKIGFFAAILMLVFIAITILNKSDSSLKVKLPVVPINDAYFDAQVMEIASKFRCGCGACGGKPLEECSCESAVAERRFIGEKVKAGYPAQQIITLTQETYGWLKPEYENE